MEERTAAQLQPGVVLGPYEVLSTCGSGEAAVVYRAHQRRPDRMVALKVVREEIARVPECRRRFVRQAEMAAMIEQPNVIPIYDAADDAQLYLAMRWIEGEELGRMIERERRLAPERAVEIAIRLAHALDAIHAAGLLHGGVEPANVLVAGDRLYLTDFAVARPAPADSLAQAGLLQGSGYSPEQTRGEEPEPRSDLYALGCVLFEMLTGRPPFSAADQVALRRAHASDPRPTVSALVPELSERHDSFIQTALAVDPPERFGSGREFAEALPRAHEVPDARVARIAPMAAAPQAASVATGREEPAQEEPAQEEPEQNILDDDVQFTVYRPNCVKPGRWYPLLAFAHKTEPFVDSELGPVDPLEEVRREAKQRLGPEASLYVPASDDSGVGLPRGSELTLVPWAEGVEFNPPRRSFRWLEHIHQEEFRMRAQQRLDQSRVRGRVSVYFGSICIAEVSLNFRVDSGFEPSGADLEQESSPPYRKIFISYSHRDVEVVEQVEVYAAMYGDEFLRDARNLRTGEVWNERLREMIRQADIFQLFWSRNSMTSDFVRQEWTYALSLRRPYFVMPVFWEDPLPQLPEHDLPPEDLLRLQFRYLPGLLRSGRSTPSTRSTAGTLPPAPPPPIPPVASAPSSPPEVPMDAEAPPPRSRGLGLLRNPAVASVLVALVIGVPLAALGVSSLGSGSSNQTSSAGSPVQTATTSSPSAPSGGGSGAASTRPSCAGCDRLQPIRCAACVGGRGAGAVDLGPISGALLRWTSGGGRFVMLLDGRVVADSSLPSGQVTLSQGSYADLRIQAPGAWSIAIS